MHTPFTSRHFTKYTDPVSGQTMAILSTKFGPIQQGIYFTNPGSSADCRYFWFSASFPSGFGRSMAVIDFLKDEAYLFPETAGSTGHMVEQETGNLYYAMADAVYYRTPDPWTKPVKVFDIPEQIKAMGGGYAISHLSFTPDKKELAVEIGSPENGRWLGTQELETGKFTLWCRAEPGICYNHIHANPVDRDYISFAYDLWDEKLRANKPVLIDGIYPRLWVGRRDGKHTMLKPYGNGATHEWWSPDGKGLYYVNNKVEGKDYGVVAFSPADGSEPYEIFRCSTPGAFNHLWHAQCTRDQNYFVADAAYPCMGEPIWRGTESMLYFHNRLTGKTVKFLTKNPVVEGWSPSNPCWYHIDPHPGFIMQDRYISFTTTVLGHVDVAIACVADLIEATQ